MCECWAAAGGRRCRRGGCGAAAGVLMDRRHGRDAAGRTALPAAGRSYIGTGRAAGDDGATQAAGANRRTSPPTRPPAAAAGPRTATVYTSDYAGHSSLQNDATHTAQET